MSANSQRRFTFSVKIIIIQLCLTPHPPPWLHPSCSGSVPHHEGTTHSLRTTEVWKEKPELMVNYSGNNKSAEQVLLVSVSHPFGCVYKTTETLL